MDAERWAQIKPIFFAAAGRPADERSAFIRSECGGDESLAVEVESLLAARDQAGPFIEAFPTDETIVALEDLPAGPMAGQQVGPYKVIKLIGRGGMGEVYLAQDSRLGRKVALKLLPAQFTALGGRVRRFEQEARSASSLNHPNIITVHDIGEVEGRHYLVTEYVEGETLRQRMERAPQQRVRLSEALEVATQVAAALGAAHGAGIAHRDIKPENVMLRPDGVVKVLDFGLAKLTEPSAPEMIAGASTESGVVMGTPRYMSPEQARGQRVDARTDIFSLGVVLYEMISGNAPFAGGSAADVIAAILDKEPVALADRLPGVPGELERIVRKALRKDREERYQLAKDMALDLKSLKQHLEFEAELKRSASPERGGESKQAATSGAHTAAGTVRAAAAQTDSAGDIHTRSSAENIVHDITRHKRGTLLIAAVLVAASVALTYLVSSRYWAGGSEAGIRSIAVLPFANESGDPNTEYLSDGVTESLIDRLSQLPNLKVMSRSSVFRYKGKEVDAQQAAGVLNVESVLMGQVTQYGGDLTINVELVDARDNSRLWGGRYNRKITDILNVQQDITREISESLRLKLTGEEQRQFARRSSANTEAYQLYLRGRYFWNKRTEEGLRKSIEYYEQAIKSDPNYALAYVGVSDSYGMTTVTAGTFPPTEAALKAKEAALRAREIDDTLAEAHVSLARVKMNFDWDWLGFEREFRRATELNPNYAEAHHMYSHYLMAMKRTAEAFAESKRYLEIEPLSLAANNHLGWHYLYARQYDEALAQLRKTAELDPNFVSTLVYLGWVYEQKKMYAEAIATFQKAVELSTSPLMLASLGHAYAVAGKRDEAQKILVQLDDLSKQRYVSAYGRAVIYAGLNESEQALAWLETAYQEHSQFMIYLDTDPRLDGLRTNLRFKDLLRRLRFPS